MTLRIAFVPVIRPAFKGDSPRAAQRSLEAMEQLASAHDFELLSVQVTGNDIHVASQQAIPSFAVSTPETVAQAAAQLSAAAPDFLLIQHTSFATGDLLAPLLRSTRRVGVWALPESAGSERRSGPLPLNALCGLNMTLSLLDHPQVAKREPVKWFYGEADGDWFLSRFKLTLAALRGLQVLATARILQIGGTAPGFYGIEEQPQLDGVQVDSIDLAELFEVVRRVPEHEAQALAQDWARPEPVEVAEAQLLAAARIELALKSLIEAGNYGAIAARCWPEVPDACGAMACAAFGKLADSRIPAACEGDVMGALSMLVLQAISGRSSILMDLSDIDLKDDSLLFWHCGNGALEWAAGQQSRLTRHFNRDNFGVVRDMVLRPGEATGFRFLSQGQEAVIIAGVFAQAEQASFDGVRGWLKDLSWNNQAVSASRLLSNVLDYRLPHHLAFGMGALTEALQELCAWLDVAPLEAKVSSNALLAPIRNPIN